MNSTSNDSAAAKVLDRLYADSKRQREAWQTKTGGGRLTSPPDATPLERFTAAKDQYMPIDRPFGRLLYSLVRAARPELVVEFGTSFGISAIYLAAALRDNGHGRLMTTEFIDSKVDTARRNLDDAGLVDLVEFRAGDAIQTLAQPLPGTVDLLFLDGEKSMYLDVVKLLEPHMKSGCLIVSDNTDHAGAETYLDHVRDPAHGYVSTPLLTPGGGKGQSGHEVSVRC